MKKHLILLVPVLLWVTGAYSQCVAKFSYSVNNLFDYGFENLSSPFGDSTITYQWNFGDGTTSTLQNPPHTFDSLGAYIVCLTMHDPTFSCSATYCDTIVIACPAVAGFTYLPGTDYSYDFDYQSPSNALVTWLWTFGNGDSSTVRNPAVTFPKTGIYDVCLTVTDTNPKCNNTYCEEVDICVAEAGFAYTDSDKVDYTFTDESVGEDASTTYLWNFGDGDSSTVKDPTHTFKNPGTYDVCFTIDVHDSGCYNQYCKEIAVACADSANFSSANIGGLTFQFTDLSSGEDTSVTYSWSFGDGTASPEKNPQHMFTSPGTHDVCLTIRNVDQGCTSTYCGTVVIACNDSAGFTYSQQGAILQFTDTSQGEDSTATFSWTFGDGDTSTEKNPAHTYKALGTYHVCLELINADGNCTSTYCGNVTFNCPVAPSFTYSSYDSLISFQDASTGEDSSAKYHWTYGDGDSSVSQNPSHVYNASGTYYVCLTVEDSDLGCSEQYCENLLVNVSGCKDTAAFTYTSVADSLSFQNTSKNVSNSAGYDWDFGDGDTSSQADPSHIYASTGAYKVCLVVTDTLNSCSSEYCQTVNVTTGINQVYSRSGTMKLYPNPATGRVNIELNGFEAQVILVFDQLGQKVAQAVPDAGGITSVDVLLLPAGIYLVSATNGETVISTTLVITGK